MPARTSRTIGGSPRRRRLRLNCQPLETSRSVARVHALSAVARQSVVAARSGFDAAGLSSPPQPESTARAAISAIRAALVTQTRRVGAHGVVQLLQLAVGCAEAVWDQRLVLRLRRVEPGRVAVGELLEAAQVRL